MKPNFSLDTISGKSNGCTKSVLQFFSGGADSTYLLLQNLLAGNKVTLTYVNITNNENKLAREKKARELLKSDIEKFCNYFKCRKPYFMDDHSITVNFELSKCPAPQQIIFAMFSLLIGKDFDEVQMGIVVGDSMRGSTLNADFVGVYREHFYSVFPDITYPVENVSKEAIYITLKGYDDLLHTHFLKHITVCEKPHKPCADKKECLPCLRQREVFKRLKWVK
jgi:hypothetical protein